MHTIEVKKNAVRIAVCSTVLILSFLVPVSEFPVADAQSESAEDSSFPYGGFVLFVIDCPCSDNFEVWMIDYASKRLLRLMFQPGLSILFLNYNITGPYLLGSFFPGGVCLDYRRVGCFVPFPPDGTMSNTPGTGTS